MGSGLSLDFSGPPIHGTKAPAKLNLGLELLARRPDGYHDLVSVVHCISLCDFVSATEDDTLTLRTPPSTGPDQQNLVFRAAERFKRESGAGSGASLNVSKHIPVAAGLGGGSSDAAAILRILPGLWGVDVTPIGLHRIAAELGSDVPLFLHGMATLVQGRGERVNRLPALRNGWFVVAVPRWRIENKTRTVYQAVRAEDFSDGARTHALAAALRERRPIEQTMFVNGLEPAACRVFDRLEPVRRALHGDTGHAFQVSGSGPTLFHYFESRREALHCARQARTLVASVVVARPLNRFPHVRRV